MRNGLLLAVCILISGMAFADSNDIKISLSNLCTGLNQILPMAAMLLVVVGAIVYAAGQIMGAETRARANVWATAALTGAVMGLLITSVSPQILGVIYGGTVSCTAGGVACAGDTGCAPGQVCCQTGASAGACVSDPSDC